MSRSAGEGGYRRPDVSGEVSSTLTGLYPYGRYAVNDRVTVWGVAGYGEGELVLTPEGQSPMRTDMDLMMGAVGLRGVAVEAPAKGGVELAVKTDAMTVRTASDAVSGAGSNLAAAEAEVIRLRLGLEGLRPFRLADGSVLTPRAEIGLRRDDGDAETGFGAEIGAGIAWVDPKRGLGAKLRGRGLLAHEADSFRERGLSGSFAWDPETGDRGPRLSLTQTLGVPEQGGTDAPLVRRTPAGPSTGEPGDSFRDRRLEARFGYGFPAFGDRFTATPEIAVGLSDAGRDYSLGWRLTTGGIAPDGVGLELAFEVWRLESASWRNAPPEHAAILRATSRF
jgi:hypothetical protein